MSDACCPEDVALRGNDMQALTCHCGEPSVYQSGNCARCGERALERHRKRTAPTKARSAPAIPLDEG
jgi:hypothetical protein